MTKAEITVEKVFPSGAWRCSAIVEGQRVHQQFLGYTKTESLAMFQHNYNLNKE